MSPWYHSVMSRSKISCFTASTAPHTAGPGVLAQVTPETATGTEQPGLCVVSEPSAENKLPWAPLTGHLAAPVLVPVPPVPVGALVCPSPLTPSAPSPTAPLLQPFLLPESLPSVQPLVCIHPLTHIKAAPASLPILNFSIDFTAELMRGIKGPFWPSPGALPALAGRARLAARCSYRGLQMPRIRRGRAKAGHCSSAAPRAAALIAQETLLTWWNWLLMAPRVTLSLDPVCL